MNYKAHIPAGIAFAGAGLFLTGSPLDFIVLIGGAIGGALPDIDVDGRNDEGSAIQHVGLKASDQINRVTNQAGKSGKFIGTMIEALARAFDAIIMTPFCRGWRWFAEHVLAKLYYKFMDAFDLKRRWGWDKEDPSNHRGGLTHSLFGMLLFSVVLIPISLLLGGWGFYIGSMLGYFSHLFCDAVCQSGVKFFWPFLPKIGFVNDAGYDGSDGIKLLPAKMLMKTGKCTSRSELRDNKGEDDYKMLRKYYYLEKGWQWLFKFLAVLFIALILLGIGPGSGQIAIADTLVNLNGKNVSIQQYGDAEVHSQQGTDENGVTGNGNAAAGNPVSSGGNGADADGNASVNGTSNASGNDSGWSASPTDVDGTDGDEQASDANGGRMQEVAETGGPTSLTYGDLDATTLPKGIIKMPDETLWVVGVGPVNKENLESPKLQLTEKEKQDLLVAAAAQRVQGIPDDIADGIENAQNVVGNAVNGAAGAAGDAANAAGDAASDAGNGLFNLLNSITGGAISGNGVDTGSMWDNWGFLGITPYTSANK